MSRRSSSSRDFRLSVPLPFGGLKNGRESNHEHFVKMPSINAAPSGTASLAISGDYAAFHWRNDVDAERLGALEPTQENRHHFKLSNF